MRTILASVLALCAASLPLRAQGYVGGVVLDSATNTPMPCVQVALVDSTERIVSRQLTMSDGMFQLDAPAKGTYRLRFFIWRHAPMLGPAEELEPTLERARKYSLNFRPDAKWTWAAADTSVDAPPGPPKDLRNAPRYPDDLRRRGIQGEVVVSYLVDSSGVVVPSSVKVHSSTHREFEAEVRSFLGRAQLLPARLDRHPVCALMREIPFTFSLGR